jgi:hypothetical protein
MNHAARLLSIAGAAAFLVVAGLSFPSHSAASLIPNHDFEVDNGEPSPSPTEWFSGGNVAYEIADDSDGVGDRSAQINANASDWRSAAVFVTPGETMKWKLDYKWLDGVSGEFSADLRFFSGFDPIGGGTAGAFRGEQRIVVASSNNGLWQTLDVNSIDVPAGALTADIRISSGFFDGGISGGGFRIDNVDLRIPEPGSAAIVALGVALFGSHRRQL